MPGMGMRGGNGLNPCGIFNMLPTHGQGSKALWEPPNCTSWRWDGRCSGPKDSLDSKIIKGMCGSQIHNMV
eukprot:2497136-Karenia_brevis.AAC.1